MDTTKQEHLITLMREVLATRFGIEKASLQLDDKLDTLGLDSMGFVEYVFEIEAALNVRFPDMPREIESIRDFVEFVDANTSDVINSRPSPTTK